MRNLKDTLTSLTTDESGHAYAWGGGSLLAVILIVLLILWLL